MTDRTINDAEEGSRPVKRPPPENVYGATLADSDAGTARGPAGSGAARDLYNVVHKIGEGGMGSLSLAQDVRLGRWVALKRLSTEFADDSRLLERFHTEARSIAALTHFHIVHVYAMAEDEEGPYIAMEYVAGPGFAHRDDWPPGLPNPPLDLEEYVKKQGVFDVTQAVQVGRKVCSAVAYAHKHGVIHRDIKPANIMINEEGEPKLADFGLARQGGNERQGMTIAGAQLLTLDYGAPEQEIDASKADERADIYALGGTLWFLVTGQSPRYFRESEVSEPLRGILVKALQKDREKRFQTAGELEQALTKLSPHGEGPSLPAAGSGLTPGRCPKCGHQHVLDPKEIFKRRFCEGCGNTLLEPCLKCDKENGVWSKFCHSCGADLAVLLQDATNRFQADREQVMAFRQASRFDEAISLLGRMVDVKHPRLREFAQWASETVPKVENEFSAAERDRDGKLQSAQAEMSAHNYEASVSLLDSVPLPLMTRACIDLRDTAQARIDEMAKLRAEIAEQVNSRQYNGLKAKVVRFLELHPGSKMQTLLKQIEQHEAQEHERCWQTAERQPSVAAYEHYLAAYPTGAYVALAHERIARCKAWEHEEFWKAVNKLPSMAAYRQYLAKYPDGRYVQQARAALAAPLREQLLSDLRNVDLRKDYLANRTPELANLDEQTALQNTRIVYAIVAGIGGAIAGAFIGGVAGWFGALLAGLVAGIAVTVFLDQ
jgi:serine/threonine protein kinase